MISLQAIKLFSTDSIVLSTFLADLFDAQIDKRDDHISLQANHVRFVVVSIEQVPCESTALIELLFEFPSRELLGEFRHKVEFSLYRHKINELCRLESPSDNSDNAFNLVDFDGRNWSFVTST